MFKALAQVRWGRSEQAGVLNTGVEVRRTAGSLGPMQRTPAGPPLHCVPPNILLENRDQQSPGNILLVYDSLFLSPLNRQSPGLVLTLHIPYINRWASMPNRPVESQTLWGKAP